MGRDTNEGIRGAMTRDGVNGISYMLRADDLSFTTNGSGEMQVMPNRLQAYAMRKGLTVNTSKSEVMHFNGRSCSSFPTFMYGDMALPEKEQLKYLGMLVDNMNLKVSEEHAARLYMAAQQWNKEFVHGHGLRNRPLAKVYGIPAGMYACGVPNIYKKAVFSRCEEYCHKMASTEPVLREYGQELLQLYWFKATVKIFNTLSMLDSNSKTLRRVLKADVHLTNREESHWSAHVSTAFSGMCYEDMFKQKKLNISKIPMQDLSVNLRVQGLQGLEGKKGLSQDV
eukprot:1152901-Pelagomonas_calceolata.AAC.2